MSWAIVVGAVIGVASTAYASYDAKEQAEDLKKEQERLDAEALELERKTMASDVNQEGATVTFGADVNRDIGDYSDFLVPLSDRKSKPALGFSTDSGLTL